MTRRNKQAVSHYLLSLQLDCSASMHAYVMTDDRRYLGATADKMLDEAGKLGCAPLDGILLATPITADIEAVRDIIRKRNTDAEHLFRTVVDFHWTVFMICADDPANAQLMAMH